MNSELDVIVIGGGHAGLSISYYLKQLNFNHLVFEKGKIGQTWRSQRWDSFRFNTPNDLNLLPGQDNIFADPEGFCSAPEFIASLENYAESNDLPVVEDSQVLSVTQPGGSKLFEISVLQNGIQNTYLCRQVVVASGGQNKKMIPAFADNIPPDILQLHSSEYKKVSDLPPGGVIVIGCAQSGIQIAEELTGSGKKVYISTCMVGRMPRRYRGKDVLHWLLPMGFYDTLTESVTDPKMLTTRQPHISGIGSRGHTLSLQSLAKSGAAILGKVSGAQQSKLFIQSNAADNISFADEISRKTKEIIDQYISKSAFNAPLPEEDPADLPDLNIDLPAISSLDLNENKITSIIWATGFTGDFSYLQLPVFNEDGVLKHRNGISVIEGLYFIGLPWMRRRKSGIVFGIKDDAEFIAGKIEEYHKSLRPVST